MDEAAKLAEESLMMLRWIQGSRPRDVTAALVNLVLVYKAQGRYDKVALLAKHLSGINLAAFLRSLVG